MEESAAGRVARESAAHLFCREKASIDGGGDRVGPFSDDGPGIRLYPELLLFCLVTTFLGGCAFRTGGPPRPGGRAVGLERVGSLSASETWNCLTSRLETSGFEVIEEDREGGSFLAEIQERAEGTLVRGGRTPAVTIYSYLAVDVSSSSGSRGKSTVQVTAVASENRLDPAQNEGTSSIQRPLQVSDAVLEQARSALSVCGAPGGEGEAP